MADHVPLPIPDFAGKTQPSGTNLSAHQQDLYDAVLKHFSDKEYRLLGAASTDVDAEDAGILIEEEKFWLTYECMLRYLRAVKWSSSDTAIKRLEATLKWRRDFGWYDKLTPEHVEPESVTGKADVFGFDVNGRPALYLTPSKQNTEESPRQVEFTFFMVEGLIDLMGPGVETLALMINFGDRGKNPSMSTSRTVLDILQSHYPERLGRALIINIPFLVNMFFKIIMPFVDPITREKVHFNPKVVQEGLFDPAQLKKTFGGDREFEYVHEKYWPTFLKMCQERRAENMKRWRTLGARIGLKEWDFKGGESKEVAEKRTETALQAPAAFIPVSEKTATKVDELPVVAEQSAVGAAV